jgi:diguanylate cyclase (GGDEF)-like protein/PAS domain S-box-containing protein
MTGRPYLLSAGLFMLAGIFVLDLLTPLGYAVWVMYIFPLFLASPFLTRRGLFLFLGGASALIMLGLVFSPADIDHFPALLSRLLEIVILWGAGWLILQRRKRAATLREEAAETLRQEGTKAQRYLDIAGTMIVALDREQRITMINQKGSEIIGYSEKEIKGWNWFDHFIPAEDRPRLKEYFRHLLEGETAEGGYYENRVLTRKGEYRVIAWHNAVIRDASGAVIELLSSGEDISERKKAEEMVRFQAGHDLLTKLPNRAFFMDHLALELPQAQRRGQKLAVMFLDIDRFKVINDTMGHTAGDELLTEIAIRLKGSMRESDVLARIGGDEFTILLPDVTHAEDAARISEKIITHLARPFTVRGQEFHVTASLGISIYPDDSDYGEDLLKNADIAMFHAKEQGGNTYQFYSPAINIRTLERIILESSLRRTLERGELVIHYQPLVDIATRKIICVEALVRWQHPDLGLLQPMQFLPLAEEIGFTAIDEWVLRSACAQIKQWQEAGFPPFCVTVNLSARQFKNPDLMGLVSRVLRETRLDAKWLELEITENLAMEEVAFTTANLAQLTSIGIKCSIDDFGTGYSSLSHLKRLPVHKLKIDKSFIEGLLEDADDRAIVNAVISLAHSLNLTVVAEGVEKEEQVLFLLDRHCDEMQGFVFSRPLPPEELMDMMAAVHG